MASDIKYLTSLDAVRERCTQVLQLGKQGQLEHFDVHMDKLSEVVQFVQDLIKRDYNSPNDVPMHSRWRHFDVGGKKRIDVLLTEWVSVEPLERTRRLIDLFTVSVLLDAGAGDIWKYKENSGEVYGRSEGLAVASLDMFLRGNFSSEPNLKRVDAKGLKALTTDTLKSGFQVSEGNPLVGVEGRTQLLNRLGDALISGSKFFSLPGDKNLSRPGFLVDYLLSHPTTRQEGQKKIVSMVALWELVIDGFGPLWPPTRTKMDGQSLGDVWPCNAMKQAKGDGKTRDEHKHLVAFHKLSQWLTYSLLEPMTMILGIEFDGMDKMTGLAEYRNGGLFVDLGLITLREVDVKRGLDQARKMKPDHPEPVPLFEVFDPVIVEWRALTVSLLDLVGDQVRGAYGLTKQQMPLVKVLEGGTWKAGREVAAKKRPKTKGPPVQIISDGTVF